MLKVMPVAVVCVLFLISLNGCATTHKQESFQIQSLKNQVSVLENQLMSKDREIDSLKDSLRMAEEPSAHAQKAPGEIKSRPTIKQIQIALNNAGYNTGSIDGKMGKQTRQAIKQFQKANDLSADGKIGKRTWELLKDYLHKKTK